MPRWRSDHQEFARQNTNETLITRNLPELIICPFLKQKIPADIWKAHPCIIVHPGVKGDRGPSSLDWAITENRKTWGATALEASDEMDAGDIWSSTHFEMRVASKASIYRREVTEAAIRIISDTVRKFQTAGFRPEPLDYSNADVRGRLRPPMKQVARRIDWKTPPPEAGRGLAKHHRFHFRTFKDPRKEIGRSRFPGIAAEALSPC